MTIKSNCPYCEECLRLENESLYCESCGNFWNILASNIPICEVEK